MAIGLTPEQAHGSLRLTHGESTTEEDVAYVEKLAGIVERRNMSPLWEDFLKAEERSEECSIVK